MTTEVNFMESNTNARTGYFFSLSTTVLAIITFGIAVCTPPLSGPFCQGACFTYPYVDIGSRFPRDYIWMYPAMALCFSYLLLVISIYQSAPPKFKLFGMAGFAFALMSTLILVVDYFIQVSVIQPSLENGETEGIALLTQFNPHGIFIALEEMGFSLQVISFFCLLPLFGGTSRIKKMIRRIFAGAMVLAVFAFVIITVRHGIMREYRFEVAVITIAWSELIVAGILLARYFRKSMVVQHNA